MLNQRNFEDMAKSAPANRPLSPHLQVWRFTATMAASITHRATGIALYTGTILLVLWMWSIAMGEGAFTVIGSLMVSPIGLIIMFGYIWALCFHMLGGLRYLYFDSGRGLAPETATKTAWAIYIGSFLLALIIGYAAMKARGAI